MLRLRGFPGVSAAAVKARPKQANKVEVAIEEQPKEETQACVVAPSQFC